MHGVDYVLKAKLVFFINILNELNDKGNLSNELLETLGVLENYISCKTNPKLF